MDSGGGGYSGDCSSMAGGSQATVESVRVVDLFRRYGDGRQEDKGVPVACDCGHAVLVETERGSLNKGQKFFSCPYGVGIGCGFRKWWTQAIVEEFEVVRKEKEDLRKSLAVMAEKYEDLAVKYEWLEAEYYDLRGIARSI